jgi:hypothetical protein
VSNEQAIPMPSDAELFQQAMTPEPSPAPASPPAPEPPPQQQPPTETVQEPVRDDRGRFTGEYRPKELPERPEREPQPQPQAAPAQLAPTDDDKAPPSHRWKEMREELEAERKARREMEFAVYDMQQRQRAAQEQLAKQTPQPQPQVPDPITDPEGYHRYVESRFENRLRTQEQNFSFRIAHDRFGDAFEHAFGEMTARGDRGDPSVARWVMSSPDPGMALMHWYQQARSQARLGPHDPDTWADKVWLEEQLKDPKRAGAILERIRGANTPAQAQAAQPNGSGGPVVLPPSLNRMAAAAPVQAVNGDMSDPSLFDFAFRQGRQPR